MFSKIYGSKNNLKYDIYVFFICCCTITNQISFLKKTPDRLPPFPILSKLLSIEDVKLYSFLKL